MAYKPAAAKLLRHYIKVEGHGETGDGKSLFGSTFPGPRFWIDPTHGCDRYVALHAADCPVLNGGECNGCGGDFVENSLNPERFVQGCEWAIEAAFAGRIKTIIVDDATVIQRQIVETKAEDPEGKVGIDEWGPIKRPINRILTKIAAAPCHLYITSRASMVGVEEEGGKVKSVYKTARPKAWDDWLYPVDYLLFFYSRGNDLAPDKFRYYAQVGTKCRGGSLPHFPLKSGQIIDNPTFERVFGKVLEFEGDAPFAEYEDPDSAVEQAKGGVALARLAAEQEVEEAAAEFRAATKLENVSGLWSRLTKPGGKWELLSPAAKDRLREAKDEAKKRLTGK